MDIPISDAIHARNIPAGECALLSGVPLIRCPNCRQVFSLARHQRAADGRISPSVICGYGCGFHATVRLINKAP